MLPLQAQKYLEIVRKRGEAGKPINRVYRMIQHRDMFLMAYTHLYANKGALTPGVNREDTIDGMSQRRIDTIVKKLQEKNYTWTPVRRTYIDKKSSSKKRPLGIPGWSDKLLQEVIRMVLEAYYEPQFRNCSHGFRYGRSCHTALQAINVIGKGTGWFIEGDIRGCFDGISHKIVYKLLAEKIKDRDFLRLIWEMLKAGYMEEWRYHTTYSGTPQGGIVSPLLMNIVLNELDVFVEDRLIPEHTAGKKRRLNTAYTKLRREAQREKQKGNWKQANAIRRQYTKMPSVDTKDPTYRRLWYVRYADDFLLGYTGTKQEAERIRERLGQFLKEELELELSEEKTLLTNAFTGKARFLNYEISRNKADNIMKEVRGQRRRTVNAILWLSIPKDVTKRWASTVTKGGKTPRVCERLEASIMNNLYQQSSPFCDIPDRGMQLAPRWDSEEPIIVKNRCEVNLHGLPLCLEI